MLSRAEDESAQAALACLVPQSQQRFPLCHVEADVYKLDQQQVKQGSGDDAAEPGTGEAQRRAANKSATVNHWRGRGGGADSTALPWLTVDGGAVEQGRQEMLPGTQAAQH